MSDAPGVVIIGGGLGGAHAAIGLRAGGYEGAITLVSAEDELPYDRTKLSKEYLQGKLSRDAIRLKPEQWWRDHDITLRLGVRATAIDRAARRVELEGGESLDYEWLVLASGSTSRALPIDGAGLPGVYMLRSLADADALRAALVPGQRLAIVGTGWIGLEVAWSATEAGMDVTAVAPVAIPLANLLGDEIGERFAAVHRRGGVDLRMNTGVQAIGERDGRAAFLVTDGGEVSADAVVIAVGAALETELAERAGLAIDRGILTDRHLVTSDPHILAIGDIANAEHAVIEGRVRREHWDTAVRHGQLAASTILGTGAVFDWQPYFFTDQFDLGMEYIGNSAPDDEVVYRGDPESGEYIAFWCRDGVVTAAMNVNIWDVNDALRALVGRRVSADDLRDTSKALDQLGA